MTSRVLLTLLLVASCCRCSYVTSMPDDVVGFPLVDSLQQTIYSAAAGESVEASTYDDVQTPGPPLDPAGFDYVFFMTDLTDVRRTWFEDGAFLPTTLTYGLAFVIGLVGNGLVIFALLFDKKWRSVTSSFLVSLAMADVVFLVVCVPYEMIIRLSSVWSGGIVLCKIAGFVEMLTASASVLNLTAISIERYAVIVHPIKSRTWCSTGRSHKIIAIVWIIAILLSSPLLRIMDTTEGLYYSHDEHMVIVTCADSSVSNAARIAFAWYQLIVMFVIPVFLMGFCYAFVIVVLWISTKELSRMTHLDSSSESGGAGSRGRLLCSTTNQPTGGCIGGGGAAAAAAGGGGAGVGSSNAGANSETRPPVVQRQISHRGQDIRDARKQVIKMLLTIIAVFFCCWGPKWVLNVMKRHQMTILHSNAAFFVMLIIHLLPYLQSCANPIIYGFMSNNFRRSLRSSCRRIPCCRLPHNRVRRVRHDDVALTTGYDVKTRSRRNYVLRSFACSQNGARSTTSPSNVTRKGATAMSVVSEM